MLCEDIMKREVECAQASETVQVAAGKMRDGNVGFLPVCDENGKVIGTLTDRDITVRMVAEGLGPQTAVRDLMTPELVCCRPSDDLVIAERLMGERQKSRIVCTDRNGNLVGVISLSDIAQEEADAQLADTVRQVTEREARETRIH
jgi:CBS domain-containing protein